MKKVILQSLGIIVFSLLTSNAFAQAITDNGTNVGISNTTPLYKLDVNGSLNLSTGNSISIGGNQVISTVGSRNIFLGDGTGLNITTGGDNAIIGFKAGETLDAGTFNTLIGLKAGQFMTTGSSNTVIGRFAGKNSNGNRNALIGREAGINTVGNDNTFIGDRAGRNNAGGNDNTMIGKNADVSAGNLINATAIGSGAQATGSNMVQLGNPAVTSVNTPRAVLSAGRCPASVLPQQTNATCKCIHICKCIRQAGSALHSSYSNNIILGSVTASGRTRESDSPTTS